MDQSVSPPGNDAVRDDARVAVPPASNDNTIGLVSAPPPTAEFTRIFLLAWIIRYIFRGAAKVGFEELKPGAGLIPKINNWLSTPGRWLQKTVFKEKYPLAEMENAAYSLALGVGSGALSLNYAKLVRSDIQNLFSESVALETGKPVSQVTFQDIRQSDNRIVKTTMHNYRSKLRSRLGTDGLFFLAAPLRSEGVTDTLLGLKGIQIFADTWKRKTTMFEDLVTFVNNKINPRNGLGQPVSLGELFDLYQHYTDIHQPDKMFTNVLSRDTSQSQLHAINQPIFSRMTELMNLTYAYKHGNAGPEEVACADFALPKFIYLLGHDLIDPTRPERTMALVEVMNARGAAEVKLAAQQIDGGKAPQQVLQQFGLLLPQEKVVGLPEKEANGVIPKGSTMQPDSVPGTKVDNINVNTATLAAQAAQLSQ